ncbi:MAG TPA: response regulator transcription factor [Actinobacteria bacterium]|nr:response regulator transcription factor [Actinomycetota bacterium]
MRILLVEDEQKIINFIKRGLEAEYYTVDFATDGEDGFLKGLNEGYDLILLDIMLPKIGGFELTEKLRERGIKTPILMLTARDTVEDKVKGLDVGADDYLQKPFSFDELLARIRAILRRGAPVKTNLIKIADLQIETASHEVKRGAKKIVLTSREYALLEYLARNKNRVLSRTQIAQHVWGYDFDTETNVVDVYIRYLRKKIDEGFNKKIIQTVRGAGYKIGE